MTDPMNPVAPAPSAPAPLVQPKRKSGGLTNMLLFGAVVVAAAGLAFAAGRATAPSSPSFPGGGQGFPTGSFNPNDVPGGNFPGGPGGGNASITISGTVKSIDGTRMTITTANGTDTVIDTSGSSYHAESPATAADVKAGSTVSVSVSGLGGFRRARAVLPSRALARQARSRRPM